MSDLNKKLTTRSFLAYAMIPVAGMGSTICASFLSGYWTDVVGISAAVVGIIMLVSRLLDGVSDILMGAIIDKTNTRQGKAKPWVIVGSIGITVVSILLFTTPNLSSSGKIIYGAVLYVLLYAVFGTMCGVASPALVNLMTTDTTERFKLSAWKFASMFIVMLGMSFGLTIITGFGGGQAGYTKFILLCSVVAIAGTIFCFVNIKEHQGQTVVEKKEKVSLLEFLKTIFGNKYFLLTMGIYFSVNFANGAFAGCMYYYVMYVMKNPTAFAVLNIATYVPCILASIVGPQIGQKIGVTKMVIICNVLMIIAIALIIFNPTNLVYVGILFALSGLFNGPACAVLDLYNAMAVDYGAYTTGVARPAVYSAGTSVGIKIGTGLGGAVFSFVLAAIGFNGLADVQTPAVENGIVISFIAAYVIAYVLYTLLVIPFAKLEKEYPAMSEELQKRREKQTL